MSIFETYREKYASLPGWFEDEAQAVWDCLLSWQTELEIPGNLGEIGVFKGKSATLAALHAKENEKCLFIDPILNDEIANRLVEAHPGSQEQLHFIKSVSDPLTNPQFIAKWNKSFRWFHIDGEHSGMAVSNDLKIADTLLHRQGIVSLDDFLNDRYPQVSMAVFSYLAKEPGSFALVLCGFKKAYLCRPYMAQALRKYIFERLHDELAQRTEQKFTLWRSTMPDDLNCFSLTHREHDTPFRGPDWMPDKISY